MKYTKLLIPTVKEVPADAEIPSHQLMIRAGLMRKLASGTYTYLPLGMRCIQKVTAIVREEMNRTGAQEILMPAVQPIELWQQTGRDVDYGQTMAKFKDRHGRINVLAPTAEEVVSFVAANELKSYKQLPFNIYQISFKFRDEFRPRFGVLRSREFIMKDAYSFHADDQSLDQTYKVMYDAYCRIFKRCGLEYVIVEAESGEMGGSGSHQFTIPCENGEDMIIYMADSNQAWNIEKAPVDPLPMPQNRPNVGPIEDIHTPSAHTIEEVAKFLKKKPKELIKTRIYKSPAVYSEHERNRSEHKAKHDGTEYTSKPFDLEYIAVLVRGDHDVNEEKLRSHLGTSVELAEEQNVFRVTGATVGFAGPVGLAGKVSKIIIDHAVAAMIAGVTGANKTDHHLKNVVPGRDFPLEGENIKITDIRNAVEGDTYQGKELLFKRGIEVGQVFKLGRKYTKKIGTKFLDENGTEQIATMGCYGIGINRIIASAIENGHDENGIIWPINIAPFEVIITTLGNDENIDSAAQKLHDQLTADGIECLWDDRGERAGVKFKDADLLGIPLRITIGKKSIAENSVEIKLRSESQSSNASIESAAEEIKNIVEKLKQKLV